MQRGLIESDYHSHHRAGLNAPDYWMPDKGVNAKFGKMQRELWAARCEILEKIGPVDFHAINGDAIDGRGEASGSTELLADPSWLNQIDNAEQVARQVKFRGKERRIMSRGCLTAGHKILTTDLRWVPVEDLAIGDLVVGFDEDQPAKGNNKIKRRWKTSKVLANSPFEADVCKVKLSDGTSLTCTWDHPFLLRNVKEGRLVWRTPEQMCKYLYRDDGERREKSFLKFGRTFPLWEPNGTWAAGYLAGFFDGEGTLSYKTRKRKDRAGNKEFVFQLAAYQKQNECLETAHLCLDAIMAMNPYSGWYTTTCKSGRKSHDDGCMTVTICGGRQGKISFLGSVRPLRLLSKLDWDKMGGMFSYRGLDEVEITDIIPAGKQTVWGLSTSSKTYVSEGFLSHNTPYHVGKLDDYEDLLADHLGATIKDHPFFTVDGVVFDMKHRVGGSSIPHGRGTAVAKEWLWNVLWAERGEQPKADVILRSHVHYHSYIGGPGWVAMTTPALQAAGSKYGGRIMSGTVDWGVVVFDVENGEFDWKAYIVNLKSNKVKAIRL